MRTRLAVLIAVIALTAAACGEPSDTADTTTPPTTGSTTPPPSTEPTTPPASDGSADLAGTRCISGSTGCNSYFGAATPGVGSTITFGGIGMTEMACLDEGVMDQEQRFLDALSRIGIFTLDDGTLVLEASVGSAVILLVAEQQEANQPLAGQWRLVTLIDGETASSVIAGTEVSLEIDLTAMTVNGNGGCNGYGGPIEVEGDTNAAQIPIRIGPLMSTLMACEESIMNQEAAALGTLGDATTASVDGSSLTISTGDGRELVFEWAGE